jgi:HemY protein
MIRFFTFIVQIAVLAAVALWLADRPGTARIVWHDTVIETSAAFLALCVLMLAFAMHMLWRLWHFLRHGPALWRLRRRLGHLQLAQDQLTQGLIAIASGNATEAGRLAVASRSHSGGESPYRGISSLWLQAQAAQMASDHRAAREIFRSLAADPEAAVLGYRGLIVEAKRMGQWNEVDRLIAELHRTKPATPWLSLIRMESAARRHNWHDAEQALSHATAAKLMENENGRRIRAALRIEGSRDAGLGNDTSGALQAAEQAARLAPDWLPAMLNLADKLARAGNRRAATRLIERVWKKTPHPELALILRSIGKDDLDAFKQVESLCRDSEAIYESQMALANAALQAAIWGEARRHLTAAAATPRATRQAYMMLAQLERKQSGDERKAAAWLTRASEAPADAVWLCRDCGGTQANWQAVCTHCGAFDSVDWLTPGKTGAPKPPVFVPIGDNES